jgi:hypothetical protein
MSEPAPAKQLSRRGTAVRSKIFISYAHEDNKWMEKFRTMLKPAVGEKIELWTDQDIREGTDWQSAIEEALASATVALLLVTDHFLDSVYIQDAELPAILKKHSSNGLKLYWVPITPVLPRHDLSRLQAAWDPEKPLAGITKTADRMTVIRDICQKIVADAGQLSRLSAGRRNKLTRDLEPLMQHWNIDLERPIGSGDSAVIYLGILEQEQVVVKALIDSPIRGYLKGALQEAERIKKLHDPGFARLIHAGIETDPQCLVLEYVDAPTVTAFMKRRGKPFHVDEVIVLVRHLAEAMQEYHSRKMRYGIFGANDVFYDEEQIRLRLSAVSISSRLATLHSIPRDVRAATYLVPEQYEGKVHGKVGSV